jgi:hypothetical protein
MISLYIRKEISIILKLWIKSGMEWNHENEIVEEDIHNSPGKEVYNNLSLILFQG